MAYDVMGHAERRVCSTRPISIKIRSASGAVNTANVRGIADSRALLCPVTTHVTNI